ncbi:MAG: hypothetical protein QXL94_01595 [Candidatus Parvarchaeum sp.]
MEIVVEKQYFDILLAKVKGLKPNEERIDLGGKYTLIYRYATMKVGVVSKERVQFVGINFDADDNDIIELVFDVEGLVEKYITQAQFVREQGEYTTQIEYLQEGEEYSTQAEISREKEEYNTQAEFSRKGDKYFLYLIPGRPEEIINSFLKSIVEAV